jgi:hypothetical protein
MNFIQRLTLFTRHRISLNSQNCLTIYIRPTIYVIATAVSGTGGFMFNA